MIKFKYKRFSEDAPTKEKPIPNNKPGWGSAALNVGFGGLTIYGMHEATKGHRESMEQGRQGLEETRSQTAAINRNLDQLEKNFAVPALLAGALPMVAMTAAPMVQSSMQMGDQKEMNEEQVAAQDRQTQAIQRQNALLHKIEQKGGTPEQAAMVTRKQFSSIVGRNTGEVKAAAKDLWNAGKAAGIGKGIKSNVMFGLGMAGLAYGVNKYISHDMKKSGLDINEQGNLVQKRKSYSDPQTQIVDHAKKSAKKQGGKFLDRIMGPGIVVGIEAPRVFGYHQEKKQLKNQISGTQINNNESVMQQRSYASSDNRDDKKSTLRRKLKIGAGILGTAALGTWAGHRGVFGKTVKNWAYFQHPGRTLTGTANVFGSYGTVNKDVMAKASQSLQKNSKTQTMRKVGDWADKHKTLANLAVFAPGMALGMGSFALGEKAIKNTTRAIDPEAYKYQDTKDKVANQT
jgi:hypothetical protein